MIQQYNCKEKQVSGHALLRFKGYNKARQILERKREITSDKCMDNSRSMYDSN